MATSKSRKSKSSTKRGASGPVRFVKDSTARKGSGTRRARASQARKATRTKAPQRDSRGSRTSKRAVATSSGPGWTELAEFNGVRRGLHPESDTYFGALSTARFAAVVLAVVTLFTLWVGHVFATQDLQNDVQRLRNKNMALQMSFDKLEGEFNYEVGPRAIFNQASRIGLSERVRSGTTLIIK